MTARGFPGHEEKFGSYQKSKSFNSGRAKHMKGFVYRLGVSIKDFGERLVNVPVLRIFCGSIIRIGLAIKGVGLSLHVN
jgi:hypothetical protein